jgi:hypothetical protein
MTKIWLRNATKEEAIKLAEERIAKIDSKDWPSDHWISLTDEWDLNLWKDDTIRKASLYPVVNGDTDGQNWIDIPVSQRRMFKIWYTLTGEAFAKIEADSLEEAMKISEAMDGECFTKVDDCLWELDHEACILDEENL